MQVRSITLGFDIDYPLRADTVARVGRFLKEARRRYVEAGIGVETVRCATQPFPQALNWEEPTRAVKLAVEFERASAAEGIEYCSLGTVPAGCGPDALPFLQVLPELICGTQGVFATIEVSSRTAGVDFAAVAAAARVIAAVSCQSELGFGNLRFAALANCPPNIPFFPAAYHAGGPDRFSLALEMADLAVRALATGSPAEAEARLTADVEEAVGRVEAVALSLERDLGAGYVGTDLSPAPFPAPGLSIGEAVENLGVGAFGTSGTLYAAALVTRALRRAKVRRCGFSGLMMPVLEDGVLARRAAEGLFSVQEALLYSAVCGTGLDTVPLPGDASEGQLAGVLLDVATLATTLDKPLTARLMPIPGKKAGEATEFAFAYFANSAVMSLAGPGAGELLRRGLAG
ncbi:MAG: DUF711 family protein [Chloroflexi bacterium]|nr:DUF711 family protein [Chloroflexota bacterium]